MGPEFDPYQDIYKNQQINAQISRTTNLYFSLSRQYINKKLKKKKRNRSLTQRNACLTTFPSRDELLQSMLSESIQLELPQVPAHF